MGRGVGVFAYTENQTIIKTVFSNVTRFIVWLSAMQTVPCSYLKDVFIVNLLLPLVFDTPTPQLPFNKIRMVTRECDGSVVERRTPM